MSSRRPVGQLKHEKVAAVLEREIRGGRVPYGRQLPAESVLAERFSVSRNTVRAALSDLGRSGLISTRSGKGSFVTFDGRELDATHGWARAFHNRGVDTTVEVARFELVDEPDLAAQLGQESAEFIAIDRVRSIVGEGPISFERSRVPAVAPLTDRVARHDPGESLTVALAEAGLVGDHGEQWIEARALTEGEAAILGRSAGEVFLNSRKVTRDALGHLVECVESVLDPAHFRLQLSFVEDER
jgi:GntR family transcriptional regulator